MTRRAVFHDDGTDAYDDGAGPLTIGGGDVTTDPVWDAKGDLIAASGADAADNLPVGTDGQMLYADSGETTGLRWDDPPTAGLSWSVLTDGDVDEPDLVYASGDVIMVTS